MIENGVNILNDAFGHCFASASTIWSASNLNYGLLSQHRWNRAQVRFSSCGRIIKFFCFITYLL